MYLLTHRITRRSLMALLVVALCGGALACGDSPLTPPVDDGGPPVDTTPIDQLPPTHLTRDDLTPVGEVTSTADGYRVKGVLMIDLGDSAGIRLEGADLTVRFGEDGRVRSISGRTRIPPPHERVTFEDPISADVGFFSGRFLNEERDLGIRVQDDTDYFVFDIRLAFQMNLATGETGANATKPIFVRVPAGGRILMVTDFADPMFYVHGRQDILGSVGFGWSLHQRIPFAPTHDVEDMGPFDGGGILTGTFKVFQVVSITGLLVDNGYTELHLTEEHPLGKFVRASYRAGINGAFNLSLITDNVLGLTLPLASATAGVWGAGGEGEAFQGHMFVRGQTTDDFSWWPAFIPARPNTGLAGHGYVRHTGAFEVGLAGRYGWLFPDGSQLMQGAFTLSDEDVTFGGAIEESGVAFRLNGRITPDATLTWIEPPQELLDALATAVNDEVLPRIAEAQAAWENLQEATAEYQFELSLRGIRSSLPTIVDRAKSELTSGINAAVSSQAGQPWQGALRTHLNQAAAPYFAELDALRAAAANATDNQQTRDAIERALRNVAARKIFTTTFTYRVLGVPVYSTTVTRRILTDQQAATLVNAANNVYRITETSNIMISMRQIYEQVDDRQLFEQVREHLEDGLLAMRAMEELGFESPRNAAPHRFDLFVRIDGVRYDLGTLGALTLAELLRELPGAMIEALIRA
jgi:hypothetical protein